ncbi:MAG: FAD-binding oxidoreductase, partial [Verrucomicrobiales bacterium]
MIITKSAPWIDRLQSLLPAGLVLTDSTSKEDHSQDRWHASYLPNCVVIARSRSDVETSLRFAHEHDLPVTARGGGVGYVGGCVPIRGGIVLSLAKMTTIKEIHREDGVAVVEPGVITGDLQAAARGIGLFYPPDPASLKECSIGGNVATNAGGPRCLKYGVTRHYVLGLEVVLADGRVLNCGSRCHKNKTGFDLVGLFV